MHRFSSRDAIIVVGSVLEEHFDGDFTPDQEKEVTFKRWPPGYQSWKLGLALNGLTVVTDAKSIDGREREPLLEWHLRMEFFSKACPSRDILLLRICHSGRHQRRSPLDAPPRIGPDDQICRRVAAVHTKVMITTTTQDTQAISHPTEPHKKKESLRRRFSPRQHLQVFWWSRLTQVLVGESRSKQAHAQDTEVAKEADIFEQA